MELTQAQRILFEVMNKGAVENNAEPLEIERYEAMIKDEEHPAHPFVMAQLEAMQVYGEAKWNEACDSLREQLKNPMIANDFHIAHINPEFKP